ncbi:MAG: RNA polymerase sigma factor [Patescibacteria group bacterium]|nr:RNA polymerase sigma factor [Patescibacteria group bacterium]
MAILNMVARKRAMRFSMLMDGQGKTDEELLALSLSHPKAFEELIFRYQAQFLARAQAILKTRDAAEDAVQDTFVRIYRFAPRFKGEHGSFRAWSLTILMNVARTHYRKGSRDREEVALLDPEHYESLPGPDVTESADAVYAKEVLAKALPKVSKEAARILTLAYLKDLPYKEIATELDISVPAVKTRVHRAKAEMRKIIDVTQS